MAFFNGGKTQGPGMRQGAPSSDIPIERVMGLKSQGYNNNQIVQSLQREGFRSDQIFDAINQADMKGGIGIPQQQQNYSMPQQDQMDPSSFQMQPEEPQPMQFDSSFSAIGAGEEPGMTGSSVDRTRIEELAEAIVEEKWNELLKNFNKILEWREKTDTRITQLEQTAVDLKDNFDKLHQAIIGKIGEYDQNILNVGTEIKAMEKVFQKVLPTFTENVNELARYTKSLKQGPLLPKK